MKEKLLQRSRTVKNAGKKPKIEKNKIHNIDVLEGLKRLDDDSCQIIIADPPYNIGKDFGNNKDYRKLEDYLEWCDQWIKECERVLKSEGTLFIYGFSEILAHISVRIGLPKRWLIWHYTNKNTSQNSFWQRSHEALISCWKNKPVFNGDDVREPYTEGFLNGSAGKKRPGTACRLNNKGRETTYNAHEKGAMPRDVIKVPSLAGGSGIKERWFLCKTCDEVFKPRLLREHGNHDTMKHTSQKPLALSDKLILSSKQNNGLMLSVFAGVGSECVSAKRLGMDFIGFELNPEYVRIAEKRLENLH